jgi:hypothetical protein
MVQLLKIVAIAGGRRNLKTLANFMASKERRGPPSAEGQRSGGAEERRSRGAEEQRSGAARHRQRGGGAEEPAIGRGAN